MPELKVGKIRHELDGRRYLIPEDKVNDFDKQREFMEKCSLPHEMFDAAANFEEDFSEYQIDSIEDLRVIIEPEEMEQELIRLGSSKADIC